MISVSNDGRESHGHFSRLPGCSGQADDAISACTVVKMEDALTFFKKLSQYAQIFRDVHQKHRWPKSWSNMEDRVVPLEKNLYGHPFGRTIMGKAISESSIGTGKSRTLVRHG